MRQKNTLLQQLYLTLSNNSGICEWSHPLVLILICFYVYFLKNVVYLRASVYACVHTVQLLQMPEDTGCLGAGVTDHCELPSTGTGKNSGSSQEQHTLIKTSAQPNLCSVCALSSQEARGEEKVGLGFLQKSCWPCSYSSSLLQVLLVTYWKIPRNLGKSQ